MIRNALCILTGHLSGALCNCKHKNRLLCWQCNQCDLLSNVRTLILHLLTKLTYSRNVSLISNTICRSHCSSAVLQNTFSSSAMNLFAPVIKVAWHTSDTIHWRNAPATSTPTALVPTPTSSANAGVSRLSSNTAVMAAIALGSVAAVAIVAVIALLFWRRRTNGASFPNMMI